MIGGEREREGGWCECDNNYVYMHTRHQVTVRNQVKAENQRTRLHAPQFLSYCKPECTRS